MNDTRIPQPKQPRRVSLFDSYGLPWTAHLSLGWILFLFVVTGGMAAIPIGLCLGVWIKAKTQSALALSIYVLLTVACAVLFLPDSIITQQWADAVGLAVVALWFAGALIGRYQIVRYYAAHEGSNLFEPSVHSPIRSLVSELSNPA
jgi:hypothetical protein